MMRAPTHSAIRAAELRIAQSKRSTRDSLAGARFALRARLLRPSTLAFAVGSATFLGCWLARPRRPRVTTASRGERVIGAPSIAGVVRAFILRFAMKALPFILQQVGAAAEERATGVHHKTA
jgi:hypothetical protein